MRPRLVDRERELVQLQAVTAEAPALVVLRGRRRVGKSFLLRMALQGARVVSFQAEESPRALQLQAFADECARLIPGAPQLSFGSWTEALVVLEAQASENGHLTVIIDEFQRVAAEDAGIESVIQNAWDRWDHEEIPVALVLSGSALSFMAGLFKGGKPTHGRNIYRPLLQPLSFRDIAPFAPAGLSKIELIERFGIIGGTPQYQRWAGTRSLNQILDEVILSPDAPLYDDPEHLIREEDGIREPGPYFGILQAIAHGSSTPSRIAGRLGISAPNTSKYLARLHELSYITKIDPIEPGGKGASRGYWKIDDPYFHFWFNQVFPNRSRLSHGRISEVAREIKGKLPQIIGPVFEDCCREWVRRSSPLGADARAVGSWWNRKSEIEIDVVAVTKNSYSVLGSCKWISKPVGTGALDDLYAGRAVLGPQAAQAKLVIFAKSGFAPTLVDRAGAEGVELVSVDTLFD